MSPHESWPNCESIEGKCPLFEISQLTGLSILDALLTFLWSAEPGARLTLQKNRDEFTLQVTGAVKRSQGDVISLEHLQKFREMMQSGNA